MYVLMVYDVAERRCAKALKVARRYLGWVQNSVFEGELTPGRLAALKKDMAEALDPDHDSVLFYIWPMERYAAREALGPRPTTGNFI